MKAVNMSANILIVMFRNILRRWDMICELLFHLIYTYVIL